MEAIGTLAGGVAHDFNNLLAVIKASVDLALMDLAPDAPVREELAQTMQAIDRATALTRQLLAFGRRQVLEAQSVEMRDLLSGITKLLDRILGADVTLTLHQTPDVTTVLADPGQLEQVVMNLCVNARDAMPEGGELRLSNERVAIDAEFCATHPWAKPGDYVRLTISDTGVGMDAQTQARIFEPFFTTKAMGRGTGLGLSVVYGIVRQHDGLIHVYSEPGHGTSFKIYLPFHGAPVAAPETGAKSRPVGGTETILLAEDDDVLRVTASRLLQRLGYRVIPAATGKEALGSLAEKGEEIDLVMLDLVMPGMNGVAVYQQTHPEHPRVRFLFTTGYSPDTSHVPGMQSLPGQVLPKPYGLVQLAQAVRRAMEG
jgi:CheY-like chemotaxis protein